LAQSSSRVALPEHQDVVKFLCDRCKTRYSIGDDRVRGKILKIRCKNCANVITVREGMPDADAVEPAVAGRARTATQANPVVMSTTSATSSGSMPAAAKLEDEWYVSIDGVQSGPFSLTTAQQWVANKPIEADLHCWCEGFDDWLPVDKVSHFRNLRKPRPVRQPTAPPPIPKQEKPLFAATMASLEKAASTSGPVQAKTTPSGPVQAKTTPSGPVQPKTNGSNAAASMFDAEPESRTTVGSPAFESESRDPFFSKSAPAPKPAATPAPAKISLDELKAPVKPIHNDDDDNLEIGEVSRVVKLADLAPKPKPVSVPLQVVPPGGTGPMPRISQTGAVPRINQTGSVPRMSGTGALPRMGNTASLPKLTPAELGMNVSSNEPHADESVVARSFADRHRRGLMLLIGVSAVMVAGVVLLFMFVVNNNNDEYNGGLGGTRTIDTSRPEDIVRKQAGLPPTNATGSAAVATIQKNPIRRPTNGNTNTNTQVEEPAGGNALKASEVEDMAAKQGEGTKRCYMRAQKGAMGFEIAEIKKINVTLTVGKDGVVNAVDLSEHANDTFGQCLIARIKAWKFRESSGGTFRISLAFSNG
jgi:predicted Zn finger-like uncharacterized protein